MQAVASGYHFGNLSKYERLQFLSGKEKVVAFFTGGWYQFRLMLKLRRKDHKNIKV